MSLQTSEATEAASHSAPPIGRARLFATSAVSGYQPMLRGPAVAFDLGDDTGPLSVDAAVATLLSAEEPEGPDEEQAEEADDEAPEDGDADEPEAGQDEEIEAGDQPAAEDDAPEEEPASDEAPDEDEEPEPEPAPAIEPPRFWSAEEKALFAKAPPEVQQLVAQKDAEAEKRVYQAKEEAAAARKDASVIGEFKSVIDQQIERAQTIFQGKWDGVDWAQWAKDNPQEAIAAKFEFDQEQEELHRLKTVQAATEAEEHRQFLIDERAKLADSGHVLADPVKGPAEKKALVEYAEGVGYTTTDLKWAGARELETLHKAMLWDRAQANAKANPPKPKPEPAKAAPAKPAGPVRPAAAAPPRKSVIKRQNAETVSRAMKSGRMDDAVAALLVLEGK